MMTADTFSTGENTAVQQTTTPLPYTHLQREYWQNDSAQPGTRYLMLQAFISDALNSSNRIVDDVRLIGDGQVRHQIQVDFRVGGRHKSVLLECKEFDIATRQLGSNVIEQFCSSVETIRPDEAVVISCLGFTPEAQKLAKQQRIKLADIREFTTEEAYGKNTGAKVHRLHNMYVTEPSISLQLASRQHIDKLHLDMKQAGMSGFGLWQGEPIYLNTPDGRIQFNEYIELKTSIYRSRTQGPVTLDIPMNDCTIEVNSAGPIPVQNLRLEFEVMRSLDYYEAIAGKIVQLIVEGFEEQDMIVFGQDITRLSINAQTGDVMS